MGAGLLADDHMRGGNWGAGCLATILATALTAGCGDTAPPAAHTSVDAWLNPPPPQMDVTREFIPASAHAPVAAEHIAEAEQFLATEPISQISPAEVSYFAGHPITLPDVSRPYLVRGAYRTKATFTVAIIGNALWVASEDVAGDTAPVRRQPLVLVMDEVPATVYVTAGSTP